MSEQLLKVLLEEIKSVRVICQKCHTIVELPIEAIGEKFASQQCPFCKNSFTVAGVVPPDPFHTLALALQSLQKISSQVKIEFVVPQEQG
ncbi:MAG TPA: hypothetical protein VKU00_26025 [Chthonomonadaceae bacterium]|nr:hypothetical protein [Chthonomonadaceae bacterium]